MKILEFGYDILLEYIKLKYPDKIICAICDLFGHWELMKEIATRSKTDYNQDFTDKIMHSEVFLLEFENIESALDFCNSISDSEPYCVVYEKGILVHENT